MADKLIRVDGQVYNLEYALINERWSAKDKFEKQVNAALNGE